MRDPEHYEYRVVSAQGVGYPSPTRDRDRCYGRLAQLDETKPMRAPHRVERRLIGEWETAPSARS